MFYSWESFNHGKKSDSCLFHVTEASAAQLLILTVRISTLLQSTNPFVSFLVMPLVWDWSRSHVPAGWVLVFIYSLDGSWTCLTPGQSINQPYRRSHAYCCPTIHGV